MLYKTELTEANVLKAVDFLIENTVIESAYDGKAVVRLVVHESQAEKAREICKTINESRPDIAISKIALEWGWDFELDEEESVEFDYGWFLQPM